MHERGTVLGNGFVSGVRALFKTLDAGVPVIQTTMLDATRRHSELDVQW